MASHTAVAGQGTIRSGTGAGSTAAAWIAVAIAMALAVGGISVFLTHATSLSLVPGDEAAANAFVNVQD